MANNDSEKPLALVCSTDAVSVSAALGAMGFSVTTPKNHAEAFGNLRVNNYSLVLITDSFDEVPHDGAGVLQYLQEMMMATRRKMYVVCVAKGAKSYDTMEAFAKSVNLIVSPEEAAKNTFGEQLAKGIRSNALFYKAFFEIMAETGRV
jgi:hypothetical protein